MEDLRGAKMLKFTQQLQKASNIIQQSNSQKSSPKEQTKYKNMKKKKLINPQGKSYYQIQPLTQLGQLKNF